MKTVKQADKSEKSDGKVNTGGATKMLILFCFLTNLCSTYIDHILKR